MLEGTVARILNQLLGKYVQDLDTGNLNVGIFSGTAQLSDLKLKPEALYELGLPIEVKVGTIGKICLEIPWTALWSQPVTVTIEDIHMIVNPIVRNDPFDSDKNKRLIRAFKKRILEHLECEGGILGGPSAFAEHLVSNILNYLQINIMNIHIRYEDEYSTPLPMAAGLCIGTITAENTNNKWKRSTYQPNSQNGNYLIKIEALSAYVNPNVTHKSWDLPSQYYEWRNTMVTSLQKHSYEGDDFKFVLNPMVSKVKMTINKSKTGHVADINTDFIVQDCNVQIYKEQYNSLMGVMDNLQRMLTSWQFLSERPRERVLENQRIWWKYAYWATLEQRVRPLTWTRMKKIRSQYKEYMETYKQIISNPNDIELRLDLQKHEDNLSVLNVVIARQHTRLLMQSKSQNEKSFWSLLPSPEKVVLCEKIGYYDKDEKIRKIDHTFNFKLGNFNLSLSNKTKEVLTATLTQTLLTVKPNFIDDSFKASLKIEGIIIEGSGPNNTSSTIVSSEHLKDSPAFVFTSNLEKLMGSTCPYRLQMTLNSVDCIYNKPFLEELETFLQTENTSEKPNLMGVFQKIPEVLHGFATKAIRRKWELNLNIKCPYFVIPETSSYVLPKQNVLVIDLGKYWIRTEICQQTQITESTTKMEMEEQLYSKLHIDCTNFQVIFCDKNDHWKDARNEKDTVMHIVPKTTFNAVYAIAALDLDSIPRLKFNISCNTLKLNISERKIGCILKFFNIEQIRINVVSEAMQPDIYQRDKIEEISQNEALNVILEKITLPDTYKYRKHKAMNEHDKRKVSKDKSVEFQVPKNNMNEAWARTVDLPGLEDNISPNNNIETLYGVVVNEFSVLFSKSSDCTDRQYLMLRFGQFSMDVAFMTFGPAYQISMHSVLLTDKLHTTSSGQYLDLIFTPLPNNGDVLTILYRKVNAKCPDFWTHFHGVETSLVANCGTLNLLLHQEAFHTIIQYSKYLSNKFQEQASQYLKRLVKKYIEGISETLHKPSEVPVPPGSVKFSQSARMSDLNIVVCDSDFDIINVQLSGLEIDFLFRANERFVFRSYLANVNVEHLSQVSMYSKVLYTDEDKVFEVKYVRNACHLKSNEVLDKQYGDVFDGSFKFQLGRIHFIFLYKLMVQLQRFVINLEILDYVEKYLNLVSKAIKSATDTLKNKTKISLSINVSGPVFLIPQKSSSPNVLVIDTGNLRIENFFKEAENGVVENILVKLKEVVITRGVMTLTSTLEMQETLIEPICINMDIKKYTNAKTLQKNWEIDSVLERIEVTLGQKDLSMIMSIYTDNIGEAKIVDLLPEQIRSPISEIFDQDDNVRELEAFFCEPKQKFLTGKCKIDEVKIVLFFDAGELLSSPIRDLNHGLCKLEINDIDASLVIYTDKSSDGKLSIDTILIEEIGPDANIHTKIVLGSPAEDGRNNNICNITVNKPPIVDVNFHQNKSGDRSADIIVGRLSLSLSVPFCEKVALYVLECIPKDVHDMGIVNPGYEGESKICNQHKRQTKSLTVSVRVNKPEFMFLVETTSNKKRYFITKSEIMVDYSRHCNRLNLVTSLSGLHSLFYDLSEYSDQPYVVLKQCDIELSRNVEDNSEKVIFTVSGLYIKLCTEVVHSVTDILNDIVEHFKIPETDFERRTPRKLSTRTSGGIDLWEPRKMDPFVSKPQITSQHLPTHLSNQYLAVPKFELVLIFELEQIQVLLLKSSIELQVQDWNYLVNSSGEVSMQANYFNESAQCWEPVLDPITVEEKEFRPWECHLSLFQDKSQYINDPKQEPANLKKPLVKKSVVQKKCRSYTTTESEDSGEDMMYLEPVNTANHNVNRRVKTSLSAFLDESDSENEEGAMEKLAAAISDLFTGDWNEQEDSDCGQSSEDENELSGGDSKTKEQHQEQQFVKGAYLIINAKDVLNITITPTFLKVFNELIAQYTSKIVSVKQDRKSINVTNDVGPHTRIELYEKKSEGTEADTLISIKKFENEESPPNSPTTQMFYQESVAFEEEHLELELKHDYEQGYDFTTIQSLNFPQETTSSLYDKVNKHYIKIFIPNFTPVQTNSSKRTWEKLVKLQALEGVLQPSYYLAIRHSIGRNGREIVVCSPLQIRNETCFALNILYQPSVLQQMNIEPLGEVTNPFETTMRIAILEAHETYNVPLYIAYHCKLFVQPAYAEGHYASDSGMWWNDMAREMDVAYNLVCKPKNNSNLEIFALRATLRKNLDLKNSLAHSVPNYLITLLPPLTVQNYLPYALEVKNLALKQAAKAEPGEKCSIYSLDLTRDQKFAIKITYNTLTWTGQLSVTGHLDDKLILMSSDQKSERNDVYINVKCEREGSCNLIFYSPYWIVNKTGLPLKVKASNSPNIQDCPNDDILLFSYKRHSKQTLNIKVYDSMWSSDFSVECSGTMGLVVCKDNERKKRYMFLMQSNLSHFCPRLSKIISILPSFLVSNNSEKRLRFMEDNEKTDLWIDLEPSQSVVFWPDTLSMQIFVKYRESNLISQAVFTSRQHKTVLRMDKGTALTVEVTGGNSGPFLITFYEYTPGDCPVLVRNYCEDLYLKIQQKDQSHVSLLNPGHSLLYTWDNPVLSRVLTWNIYNNKGSGFVLDIHKDGYGEEKIKFQSVTPTSSLQESSSSDDSDSSGSTPNKLNKKVRKDKIIIYWACFVEGSQRVLLFTQEQRIFENVLTTRFKEFCTLETILSISGIGLSLFTSDNDIKEHLYASLCDSPSIWEVNVGHKWKTLTLELASWIEDKYKRSSIHKKCQIKDYVHIDFEKMFMLKPFFAEIRRTYTPAVYCHFRKSPKFRYIDFRLNYLQIDNKHSNCIVFQPVFHSGEVPNNHSLVRAITFKQTERNFQNYRYIKINLSDISLNIENDLWSTVADLLKDNQKFGRDYSLASAYVEDLTAIKRNLSAKLCNEVTADTRQKPAQIELMTLSSFGVQLTISNRIQMSSTSSTIRINRVLDYLFPHNMAPYMPLEGVHHKVAPAEWMDSNQDTSSAIEGLINHVTGRFLQQYYSQVLGLQVLVNSFDRQTGVEAVLQSTSNVASTIFYGFQCLLGHMVMSPAALETCILDVFPNFNIEQASHSKHSIKRGSVTVVRNNNDSAILPKSIVKSGRSFEVAVPIALSQLFIKSYNVNSYCDGEMFFKTSGKALISLITKHQDEKSDFVEIAKESLRRAFILGEPIKIHQRLTRYRSILGLTPFSVYESLGHYLLETIGNSRFSNDKYWAHAAIDRTGKSIIIVSLEHIIRVNKCTLWSSWEIEWEMDLDDIISMPKMNSVELIINMRQNETTQGEQQIKISGPKEILAWLHEKIEQAIILSMEDKSWALQKFD
ncbi:intermembrane lipid transfer protein VPS13A-like [Euwallacea similis]|uniref:intermembrane lipid transfer protein VPS13A-like n=1 Tax=Euwallacea similis TaxID=1736056 RepID=UPI00344B46DF